MSSIVAYLAFDGNCREAMEFYGDVFGSKPDIRLFKDGPIDVPESSKENVMHSVIQSGGFHLMASDLTPGYSMTVGDNVSLSINCDSEEQQTEIFEKLAIDGEVGMPLEKTFWGARFGMLADRFGVNWLVNFDYPSEE